MIVYEICVFSLFNISTSGGEFISSSEMSVHPREAILKWESFISISKECAMQSEDSPSFENSSNEREMGLSQSISRGSCDDPPLPRNRLKQRKLPDHFPSTSDHLSAGIMWKWSTFPKGVSTFTDGPFVSLFLADNDAIPAHFPNNHL